uniref:Uncharacterized protein n=1 Tax=Amphimedon queenslandica TaxID=400682 RepID=A0A1X7TYF7_AMPQE
MKLLKNDSNKDQNPYLITSNRAVEDCIKGTKVALNLHMKQATSPKKHNASGKEDKALRSLMSPAITIKPADKNLGIVILKITRFCYSMPYPSIVQDLHKSSRVSKS